MQVRKTTVTPVTPRGMEASVGCEIYSHSQGEIFL